MAAIAELDKFIDTVIDTLGERGNETAEEEIKRMVYKRGPMLVADIVKRAKELYVKEHPLTTNGTQRTLGGCYFYLYPKVKKEYRNANKLLPPWPFGRPE